MIDPFNKQESSKVFLAIGNCTSERNSILEAVHRWEDVGKGNESLVVHLQIQMKCDAQLGNSPFIYLCLNIFYYECKLVSMHICVWHLLCLCPMRGRLVLLCPLRGRLVLLAEISSIQRLLTV